MKISVIIPAYNVSNYIIETVNSILNQNYDNCEIIIINDGSTDDTKTLLTNHYNCNKKIKIIHQENHGVGFSRNVGINIANGDYLLFLDGDDLLYEGYFNELEEILSTLNFPDLVLFDWCEKNDNKITKKYQNQLDEKKIDKENLLKLIFSQAIKYLFGSILYKSSHIKNNNIFFDNSFSYYEDFEFLYRAILFSEQIRYVNKMMYVYVKNRNNSATNIPVKIKAYQSIQAFEKTKKIFEETKINADILKALNNRCSYAYLCIVNSYIINGGVKGVENIIFSKKTHDEIKKYKILNCKNVPIKIGMMIFLYCPALYKFLVKKFHKILKLFV